MHHIPCVDSLSMCFNGLNSLYTLIMNGAFDEFKISMDVLIFESFYFYHYNAYQL